MKRKVFIICLSVVLVVCVCLLWFAAANSLGVSVGRCLVAQNGSVLLIKDNSPIVLSKQGSENMFNGLQTGDKILVIHDGIQETYPGGTEAWLAVRLEKGSIADIPEDVIAALMELGWPI